MSNVILARMGEVTLKGLNRGNFETQLKHNLKWRLRGFGKLDIYQSQSRIWIEAKDPENPNFADNRSALDIMNAVTQVFGIVSVSFAVKFEGDFDSIRRESVKYVRELLEEHPEYKSFKVDTRRGNKNYPLDSQEICAEVGGDVIEAYPVLSAKMKDPDFTLMVEIRDEKYAIALGSIQIIEDISIDDIKYVEAKEVVHLRGNVIPIIRLDQLLDFEPLDDEPSNLTVVVVKKGDLQAGLVVDNLIGQQEIVIKSLGKVIDNNKLISGATILGDGEVAMILDVNALM